MRILEKPRAIAKATPDDRLRSIDLVRTVSMLVVVVGHWLLALVWINSGGETEVGYALSESKVMQYMTWILQVMPLFFLAGGFSNARSYAAARNKGTPRREWLVSRMQRIIKPTLPVIAFWSLAVFTIGRLADQEILQGAVLVATIPMWFLSVYLMAVMAAPFTLVAWEKWGVKTIVFGIFVAVLVDIIRIKFGVEWFGYLNFLAVWLTIHQAGHGWDKRPSVKTGWVMAGVGLALLAVLTSVGPYAVSMVGVPGATQMGNTAPPTIVLLALALFQAGLLVVSTPRLERWLKKETPWSMVILASAFSMSVYLWHKTAMVILILTSVTVAQGLIQTVPLTATWWMTRPVWIALLILVTLPLVAFFQRFERNTAKKVTRSPLSLSCGAVIFSAAILSIIALGLTNAAGQTRLWIPLSAFVGASLAGAITLKSRPSPRA
jgi:hypothetical protein